VATVSNGMVFNVDGLRSFAGSARSAPAVVLKRLKPGGCFGSASMKNYPATSSVNVPDEASMKIAIFEAQTIYY
jgi:hypothetical protein